MSTICPSCGHEQRAGGRFCPGRGTALPLLCRQCGNPVERDDQFCATCGTPMAGSPSAVPDPAMSAQPAAERERDGERKQLTVLFADVQGSMDLQEGLDPEV